MLILPTNPGSNPSSLSINSNLNGCKSLRVNRLDPTPRQAREIPSSIQSSRMVRNFPLPVCRSLSGRKASSRIPTPGIASAQATRSRSPARKSPRRDPWKGCGIAGIPAANPASDAKGTTARGSSCLRCLWEMPPRVSVQVCDTYVFRDTPVLWSLVVSRSGYVGSSCQGDVAEREIPTSADRAGINRGGWRTAKSGSRPGYGLNWSRRWDSNPRPADYELVNHPLP